MRVHTKRFTLLAITAALIVAEFVMVFASSPIANAAVINQPTSPIPANMTHWNREEPSTQNITRNPRPNANTVRHVLKKESSSSVMDTVEMAAYFSEARADSAHRIQIADKDIAGGNERCHTYPSGNQNSFIQVILSVDTSAPAVAGNTQRQVVYNIPKSRVCSADAPYNHNNAISQRNNGNLQFFGWYNVPTGFRGSGCATGGANYARCDAETGLYKVNITIRYGNNVQSGRGGDGGVNKQQITFRVRLNTSCGTSCTRYLSIVPAGGGRNYSTLGELNDFGNPWYTDQAFQFGLPCTERVARKHRVILYDIDNQGAGGQNGTWGERGDDTTFEIQRRVGNSWVAQNFVRTGDPNNHRHVEVTNIDNLGSSVTRFTPTSGSGITTTVRFWMEPNANYRVKMFRVHNRNLLGVGLPTETIFGDIDCDYSLQPNISGVPETIVPGAQITSVIGSVRNNSSAPTYIDPQTGVVRFIVPAGAAFTHPQPTGNRGLSVAAGNNTANPAGCRVATAIAPSSRDCTVFGAGARSFPPRSNPTIWSGNDTLADATVNPGDRICYMTIVNLYDLPATPYQWKYSTIQCAIVQAQPSVAIWGSDLRVGSTFSGGAGNLNSRIAGRVSRDSASWVEYAITAPRQVQGIASQSGAVSGSTAAQGAWSQLTFANTGTAGCPVAFGCYTGATNMGTIPNVRAAVATMNGRGVTMYDRGAAGVDSGQLNAITGGDIANFSGSAAIITSGTITINDNIVYRSDALSGAASVPQLVLIGSNINIAPNVTRIDAWLIADSNASPNGLINTCSSVTNPSALRSNICDTPLAINGPVMARQLLLNRTHSGTANAPEAAETINLRGDAYVWSYGVARLNGQWQTVHTSELPPRY